MKAWVVIGSTGEYEDFHEWNVVVYTNKAVAEKHMKLANKEAKNPKYVKDDMQKNPYDEQFHMDYTGTSYDIEELEISDIKTVEEFTESVFLEEI